MASREGTTAHVWRDLVVVIPNTDYYRRGISRLFVRTATGWWREIQVDFQDLADGIDPPMLSAYKSAIDPGDLARIREAVGVTPGGRRTSAWIEEFLPDRGEVRVLVSAGSSRVKLRLGLAADGAAGYIRRLTSVSVGATSSANMRIERRARRVSSPGRAVSRSTRR